MQQDVNCKDFLKPELVFSSLHHVVLQNTAEIHVLKESRNLRSFENSKTQTIIVT